ncbi:MAG: hypothetical protein ACRCX8_00770 [Sarcina sp.]
MKQQITQTIGKLIYQKLGEKKSFVNENNETIYLYSFEGSNFTNWNRSECSEIELLNGNKDFMKEIGDLYEEREIVALEISIEPGNEYLFKMPTLIIKMSEKENINSRAFIHKVGVDGIERAIESEVDSIIWDALDDREPIGTHTCSVKALISEKLIKTNPENIIKYLERELNPYGYDPYDEGYDDDSTKTYVNIVIDNITFNGVNEKHKTLHDVTVYFTVSEYDFTNVDITIGDEVYEHIKQQVEDQIIICNSIEDITPFTLNRRLRYININEVNFNNSSSKIPTHILDAWVEDRVGKMELCGFNSLDSYFTIKSKAVLHKRYIELEISIRKESCYEC